MNVKTLNQYLQNLITPLQAGQASNDTIVDLERITGALGAFADKPIGEFATFLERSREYEREGHWPESAPAIVGEVVDKPTPAEYAERLRTFLAKEVPADGPMSAKVEPELERLKKAMSAAELKEMARACGVAGSMSTGPAAIQKAFEQITNKKLSDALTEFYVSSLQEKCGEGQLDLKLAQVSKLTITQVKAIAKQLGVKDKITSKPDGIKKIKTALLTPAEQPCDPALIGEIAQSPPQVSQEKINQIVETLNALKDKADPEEAPYAEIEDELNRLTENMSVAEAVAAAKQFEVPWSVSSKTEAVKRIREKVLERKLIREKIRL